MVYKFKLSLGLLTVTLFTLFLVSCGSSGSTATTCGTGTHSNGAGTCVLDNALAIENSSADHWNCTSFGNIQFLSDDTGMFDFSSRQAIAWAETSGSTTSITFTAGASNYTFTNITPDALTGATSFTAYENGSQPTTCSLINSAFP